MARERLTDKLLRLTEENAALKAEISACKSALDVERKIRKENENLLNIISKDKSELDSKYFQEQEKAFRLKLALKSYHDFATYQFWWLNRDHDLGLDLNLCHFGWDEITDREIINELFPEKKREENEAKWEAQWQRLHRYKARCSSGPLRIELDDIWKSFKTVSNGSK